MYVFLVCLFACWGMAMWRVIFGLLCLHITVIIYRCNKRIESKRKTSYFQTWFSVIQLFLNVFVNLIYWFYLIFVHLIGLTWFDYYSGYWGSTNLGFGCVFFFQCRDTWSFTSFAKLSAVNMSIWLLSLFSSLIYTNGLIKLFGRHSYWSVMSLASIVVLFTLAIRHAERRNPTI